MMHKSVIDKGAIKRYNGSKEKAKGEKVVWDLTVTHIVNVFYRSEIRWARDTVKSRAFEAAVLFTDGAIEYHFGKRTVTARRGDLLLLPSEIPYNGKRLSDTVSYFVLDFTCIANDEYIRLGAPCRLKVKDLDSAIAGCRAAAAAWNDRSSNADLRARALLYTLLYENIEVCETEMGNAQTKEILLYVSRRFSDPHLSTKEICEEFFISESQLRRNVRKATGLNTNDYILSLRIGKAKNELCNTEKSVKEIAADCGFSSPYYFSRCFARATGMSPTAYRAAAII